MWQRLQRKASCITKSTPQPQRAITNHQAYGKPATMSRITLAFMQDTGWCVGLVRRAW